MALYTRLYPIWRRPPLTPWKPEEKPEYSSDVLLQETSTGSGYNSGNTETEYNSGNTETEFSIYDEMYIEGSETDGSKVKWLSGSVPSINSLIVGTSKKNYYYTDRFLKNKLTIPGVDPENLAKPLNSILGAYKGYYADSPGHLFSVAVAVELPFDINGAVKRSVYGLWVDPFVSANPSDVQNASQNGYGTIANNNPYGNETNPNGSGSVSNVSKSSNSWWLLLAAFLFLRSTK